MEELPGAAYGDTYVLICIENLLEDRVWCHPSVDYDTTGQENYIEFHKRLGWEVPEWAIPTKFCRTHGDPTVSNCMVRRDGRIVLIDPRPPRCYVPQCREADMGRILQSALGWETAAYGIPKAEYVSPTFWFSPDVRNKAIFWCGAAAVRILHQELKREKQNTKIIQWCEETRDKCRRFIS